MRKHSRRYYKYKLKRIVDIILFVFACICILGFIMAWGIAARDTIANMRTPEPTASAATYDNP